VVLEALAALREIEAEDGPDASQGEGEE